MMENEKEKNYYLGFRISKFIKVPDTHGDDQDRGYILIIACVFSCRVMSIRYPPMLGCSFYFNLQAASPKKESCLPCTCNDLSFLSIQAVSSKRTHGPQ